MEVVTDFLFLGPKITADGDGNRETRRQLLLGRKAVRKWRQCIKKQGHHFANKGLHSQGYGLSGSHAWMRELDHKEGRVPKNWCFQTVVLEKTLERLLECKGMKPVNLKGNQLWILFGRTDAEAEVPIIWPPASNCWLIGKDPDAGKDWRQEEKRATEDEMVGWHHQLNGHEFEHALWDSEGQGVWHAAVLGTGKSQTQMSDSTTSVTQELPRWCSGKEPTCHCRR